MSTKSQKNTPTRPNDNKKSEALRHDIAVHDGASRTFFFVTLEEILKLSVFARSLRNSAIFEVTIENLLTSVFCLNLRIERTLDVEPPACFNGSLSGAKVHIFVETDTALSFKLKTN